MNLTKKQVLRLSSGLTRVNAGHPWVGLDELECVGDSIGDGCAVPLYGSDGNSLGCGVFDRRDEIAVWRRFSWAEDAAFDESYIADALQEALGRRGEESCRRLISSDADYLPGLIVEQYEDVLTVSAATAVIDGHLNLIAEILKESLGPREIVFLNDGSARDAFGLERSIRTLSGNNLKGSWITIDELKYRIDLLNPEKPGFFLDQREQHALVGSLCEGRVVLDAFSHSGAFALHALQGGAEHVVAIDRSQACVKAIGANAQRNECFVEAMDCDVVEFLAERAAGDFDAIILDPPEADASELGSVRSLHASAFRCLPAGGIMATYCRSASISMDAFERMVSAAAATAGREGRIFARTSQPFDFPTLLSFPESHCLKGLILQVE
jgi:23S rRNA (cytosine1962-C5)-methyltransferase